MKPWGISMLSQQLKDKEKAISRDLGDLSSTISKHDIMYLELHIKNYRLFIIFTHRTF